MIYAILVGFVGGSLQVLIQNACDKRFIRKYGPIATVSYSLFAVQGLLGSAFAAVYKAIIQTNSYGLVYTSLNYVNVNLFVYGIVSSAMGIAFGILGGIVILLVNGYKRDDYFTDRAVWKIL